MTEYRMVAMEKCTVNEEFNSRTNGVGDVSELAESMKAVGVLEPLLGKDKENEAGEVEIYAGFRRFAAAELAELEEIPVLVKPRRRVTRRQMFLVNITENVQRENLNPLDEAFAFKRMQEEHKMSVDDIALEVGLKKVYVRNRIKLLKLSAAVQNAVKDDRISQKAAFEIDRLPVDKQAKYVTVAENLHGQKLVSLIDKELEKLSKQTTVMKEEETPESVDVTEFIRKIKSSVGLFASVLQLEAVHKDAVRGISYREMEAAELQGLASMYEGLSDILPDETQFADKAGEEIRESVFNSFDQFEISTDAFKEVVVAGIRSLAEEMAVERTSLGKKPKVTFVLAKEALGTISK